MMAMLRILGFSQKLLRVANWDLLLLYYGGGIEVLSGADVGTAALGCPSERTNAYATVEKPPFMAA
jgi:hypothetical protein